MARIPFKFSTYAWVNFTNVHFSKKFLFHLSLKRYWWLSVRNSHCNYLSTFPFLLNPWPPAFPPLIWLGWAFYLCQTCPSSADFITFFKEAALGLGAPRCSSLLRLIIISGLYRFLFSTYLDLLYCSLSDSVAVGLSVTYLQPFPNFCELLRGSWHTAPRTWLKHRVWGVLMFTHPRVSSHLARGLPPAPPALALIPGQPLICFSVTVR